MLSYVLASGSNTAGIFGVVKSVTLAVILVAVVPVVVFVLKKKGRNIINFSFMGFFISQMIKYRYHFIMFMSLYNFYFQLTAYIYHNYNYSYFHIFLQLRNYLLFIPVYHRLLHMSSLKNLCINNFC